MKKILYLFAALLTMSIVITACNDDEGNYTYLTDEEVGVIKFDTTGMTAEERYVLNYSMDPGDKITFKLKVDYKYADRLNFRWFVVPHPYTSEKVGNSWVYPEADTIANTLELIDWECDLEPGNWRFYCMAEDPVNGMRGYYQAQEQYVSVTQAGAIGGLYMLTETADGNTDIEIMSTSMLMGGGEMYPKYYSQLTGKTLQGKPRFIKCGSTGTGSYASKDYYMVCTDQNMYRLNEIGMQLMDDWNGMFYTTPEVFNPQAFVYTNNCNFLLNDGKLHVLYVGSGSENDGLFSAPINGDYEADSYLMYESKTTWRPAENAIDADQVIFDKKNKRFRPYFPKSASISNFSSTAGDAYLNANNVTGEIIKLMAANNHHTYLISKENGEYFLNDFNFYNRPDQGDLSGNGDRSHLTLSAAAEIQNAKYYASCASAQSAFYYATDKKVYSIAPSRGLAVIDSRVVFEAPGSETITCIYCIGSHSAGFPWATAMLYVATWDGQQGKVYEYEMDHAEGVPTLMWTQMIGNYSEIPSEVTTGWGKIRSMTWMQAE